MLERANGGEVSEGGGFDLLRLNRAHDENLQLRVGEEEAHELAHLRQLKCRQVSLALALVQE
jgi:hypothetical protein